ncbi:hypothetical protein BV22DRAFT_1009619 [Leucogyrophana mollusca]|uniref:Uncharacterized protein n=1 Tax=Leucogyrophana mollusca TaxID=85980 RepID=A0ACB8BKY1_9AGAM|nr:hypothetical protein BV22DRAFT_1009619 [Leucogyrophana mollusca]
MSTKQERIDALLRKSLLGEELINTQFHLYSTRSRRTGQVTTPRALFANNILLTESAEYFAKLLGECRSDDPTLIDFDSDTPLEDKLPLDAYDYASDSDLEDEEGECDGKSYYRCGFLSSPGCFKEEIIQRCALTDDDETSLVESNTDIPKEPFEELVAQEANDLKKRTTTACTRPSLRPNNSRNIFVKDTAFATWQALLFYLYTDKIVFAPLRSQSRPSIKGVGLHDPPPCSPKSMYRLASKIGHEVLKEKALLVIHGSLTEMNILQELTTTMSSRYPAILEVQVGLLYQHIASRPVVEGLPALIKRIARGELPHGADIVTELYQRVLLKHYPSALRPAPLEPMPAPLEPVPALFDPGSPLFDPGPPLFDPGPPLFDPGPPLFELAPAPSSLESSPTLPKPSDYPVGFRFGQPASRNILGGSVGGKQKKKK